MKLRVAAAATLAALACTSVQRADAAVVLTMLEVGGDVVVSGGGTVDTDGITLSSGNIQGVSFVNARFGAIRTGTPSIFTPLNFYTITGPTTFGAGGAVTATSGSGDMFGVIGGFGRLDVPDGYISGSALSGTATFAGRSFASLGVTTGTYVWSWGSGADFDTFTLLIGADAVAAARVPAPASALLLGLGIVVAALARSSRSA